jgi:hypothetical protein
MPSKDDVSRESIVRGVAPKFPSRCFCFSRLVCAPDEKHEVVLERTVSPRMSGCANVVRDLFA